jgi:glucokinase
MTHLATLRQQVRDRARRVSGEHVISLQDLKPIYDELERLAGIGQSVLKLGCVIRVEDGETWYMLQQDKAEELWKVLYEG